MSDNEFDDFASDEEDFRVASVKKPRLHHESEDELSGEGELSEGELSDELSGELSEEEEVHEDNVRDISQVRSRINTRAMTPEQLEKQQKKIKKTGVCYLSSIPPYMKPSKLRSILLRFGKVDRIFLKPEDTKIHKKRVKYGGNKKKRFTEGWVEFVNKKDAKLCCATMNGNIIGGKKTSYYYDDILNIKYLKGFKWLDLTQQISKENEVRQSKLTLELSQQQKLNKNFLSNLDQAKMVRNIKRQHNDTEIDLRRNFKQRDLASKRASESEAIKEKNSAKLDSVLRKVF